jgi:hypothetical protein
MMEDLEANNTGDNFTGNVEIQEEILPESLAAVRTHQYAHF